MLPALEQASGGTTKFSIVPGATTGTRAANLKNGTTPVSWMTALDALYALQGVEDFKDMGPQSWRTVYMGGLIDQGVAARADSGIKTLQDLRGKKVATYPAYPVVQAYMDAAMAFAGLSWNDVRPTPVSSFAAGQTAIGEGAVDAAVMSDSAAAQDLAASFHGIQWLPMPAADIEGWKRFQQVIPVFYPNKTTVAAGTSATKPAEIWGYNYHVIAYDYTDENLIYWFTKLMFEGYPLYKDNHAYLLRWTPEHALEYTQWFTPQHAGSIKYIKSIGKWTPQMEAKQQAMLKLYPQTNTK